MLNDPLLKPFQYLLSFSKLAPVGHIYCLLGVFQEIAALLNELFTLFLKLIQLFFHAGEVFTVNHGWDKSGDVYKIFGVMGGPGATITKPLRIHFPTETFI